MNDTLAHFEEHGYARAGRFTDDVTLAALRARADDLMLGRITYPGLFFQIDSRTGRYADLEYGTGWQGPSLDYRKVEKLELDPLYRAQISHPALEPLVRALIPDDGVVIYRALLMTKPASGGTVLPWHQDGGHFWGLDRDPTLQVWTALDDAPAAAGCVEVFPGSHKRGLVTPSGGVVPQARAAEEDAEAQAVALPAVAGESILIHNHLWHRSGVNTTGQPRRAFTVCYMSAATRCLRKKRAPRVFFPVFTR